MPRLRLLLSLLLIVTAELAAGGALAQPRIEWEIANRFRLFRDEAQFRKLAEVYAALPASDRRERPAFAFEDAMQRAAAARRLGPAFGDPASIERWGWTSAVTRKTCFQNGNRGHWQCLLDTGDQFMEPRVADVLVRLAELPPALTGKTCRWTAGELAVQAPCSGETRLPRRAFGEPFDIAVSADAAPIAEARAVKLRHVAIAGFGDSFSSGEGNPDRPAELIDDNFDTYKRSSPLPGFPPRYRNYPRRHGATDSSLGGAAAAIWLNAQCHRSLYSQHVRAALTLALAHRDIAVTLTPYSCTGAEVTAGLLGYYAARDDVGDAVYDASPQLMRYWRDYCRSFTGYNRFDDEGSGFDWRRDLPRCNQPRAMKPDAVLLSIGGNDIGFSSVIAEEVVGRGQFGLRLNLLYKLWLSQIDTKTFAEARRAVDQVIPARIRELSAAFEKHLDVPASSIVQTAYPQMTRDAAGPCGVSDAGMDVHRILAISKESTGREGAAFVPYLNRGIASAIAALPEARRWRFVAAHVERFVGHALCTAGAPADAPDREVSGAMRFPTWNFAQRRWEPFAPSAWRAYRPRQRWFVTPNDSFLSGHYMRVGRLAGSDTTDPLSPEQPLFAATLGGSFHPNASGHAAIADATVPVLREVLGLPQP